MKVAWKSITLGDGFRFVVYSSQTWMVKSSAENLVSVLLVQHFLHGNTVRFSLASTLLLNNLYGREHIEFSVDANTGQVGEGILTGF